MLAHSCSHDGKIHFWSQQFPDPTPSFCFYPAVVVLLSSYLLLASAHLQDQGDLLDTPSKAWHISWPFAAGFVQSTNIFVIQTSFWKNLIIQKYFFWLQNFVLPGSTFQKLSITHTFFFKACRYLSLVTAFWKRSEANKSVSLWIFSIFLSFLFLWFLVVYCHTNCYQAVELTVSRRGVHSGWLTFSFLFLPSWYTASVFVWLWMCVHAYGCVCKCLCLLHRCDLTVACF